MEKEVKVGKDEKKPTRPGAARKAPAKSQEKKKRLGEVDMSKKSNKIIFGIIGLVIFVMLGAVIFRGALQPLFANVGKFLSGIGSKPSLSLVSHNLDRSNRYMVFVEGSVSNDSNAAVKTYASISFDALDASGANVGSCLANTNTIDARGTWKFRAMCPSTTSSVRLKNLSGS